MVHQYSLWVQEWRQVGFSDESRFVYGHTMAEEGGTAAAVNNDGICNSSLNAAVPLPRKS